MTAANAFHPISLITAAQTSSQAVALPKEKKNKNFAKKKQLGESRHPSKKS